MIFLSLDHSIKRMNEILYKPRTGAELLEATPCSKLALYSYICDSAQRTGAYNTIRNMMKQSYKWFVLLQSPMDPLLGHWMALNIIPEKKEIYFFSSYGGRPDFEKNEWLPEDMRIASRQNTNAFNDALKYMMRQMGWKVHYNDHPYQIKGDHTATCGIWAAAFLNSMMNPDEFYWFNQFHHLGAEDYYKMFFVRN